MNHLVYARRPRALAMLERARPKRVRVLRRSVPVVDVEALIGLKLQAIANEPSRRGLDELAMRAFLAARDHELDLDRWATIVGCSIVRQSSKSGFVNREGTDPRADARSPIVLSRFRRREELRSTCPVDDLDEFLAFLDELEEVFGPLPKPPRITRGSRFVL